MKLQAAIDKLFSHKLFSNKYFLYAVVAASILTNYMRIVAGHYEVVGFFILVGIIMMNFSKNIAVVFTVCLLLTQLIMAGKAVQEGLENKGTDADYLKYLTPDQLKTFSQLEASLRDVNVSISNEKKKLLDVNTKIKEATTAMNDAKKEIAENNAAYAAAKKAFNNASPKDKVTRQRTLEIAKDASKSSKNKLAEAKVMLDNYTKKKIQIEANLAKYRSQKEKLIKNIGDIKKIARAAKAKAAAEEEAKAKAKAEADRAKAFKDAQRAKAKEASKRGIKPGRAIKSELSQQKKEEKAAVRMANATAKFAAKKKPGPNPFKRKNKFALLSGPDDDTEDENNGIDFLEPSNLTSVTQGTTNLMTKQKDLFSVMNSMTPLIDNAKKMLSTLDLSKLRN